eukprot:Gb_03148 [translate_table: standard]
MADSNIREHFNKRHDEEKIHQVNDGDVVQNQGEQHMPSSEEEVAVIKKKYGGIIPKKPPLISKLLVIAWAQHLSSQGNVWCIIARAIGHDHERAFFDSADWALGKQGAPMGQRPKGPLEALRPKLQPTPHQPLPARRSAYATADEEDEAGASGEEAVYNV